VRIKRYVINAGHAGRMKATLDEAPFRSIKNALTLARRTLERSRRPLGGHWAPARSTRQRHGNVSVFRHATM
jgi:hypothetical protein